MKLSQIVHDSVPSLTMLQVASFKIISSGTSSKVDAILRKLFEASMNRSSCGASTKRIVAIARNTTVRQMRSCSAASSVTVRARCRYLLRLWPACRRSSAARWGGDNPGEKIQKLLKTQQYQQKWRRGS